MWVFTTSPPWNFPIGPKVGHKMLKEVVQILLYKLWNTKFWKTSWFPTSKSLLPVDFKEFRRKQVIFLKIAFRLQVVSSLWKIIVLLDFRFANLWFEKKFLRKWLGGLGLPIKLWWTDGPKAIWQLFCYKMDWNWSIHSPSHPAGNYSSGPKVDLKIFSSNFLDNF